jgi:hypothetical protein
MRGPPACRTSRAGRSSSWPSSRCTPRATSPRPRPRRRGAGDPSGRRAGRLYDAHSLISTIFWWLGDAAGRRVTERRC